MIVFDYLLKAPKLQIIKIRVIYLTVLFLKKKKKLQ